MGKKSPKQSPKKEPVSADVADSKPEKSTQASKQPAAKPSTSQAKKSQQKRPWQASSKGQRNKTPAADDKKETMEERLARQKALREALLEQGSHDNIEVIVAPPKKRPAKKKRREPKEGEEPREGVEEEEDEESPPDLEERMEMFISSLETREFSPEHEKALATVDLLEFILLEEDTWKTTRELLDRVMSVNFEVAAKVPYESTPRCVIYRFRKLIIDEFTSVNVDNLPKLGDGVSAKTFFREVTSGLEFVSQDHFDLPDLPPGVDLVEVGAKVKQGLIAALEEYKTELENIPNLIASHGKKLIKEGDVIMTHSYCTSTSLLFLEAAKDVNFTLYTLESTPLCWGHLLQDDLVESSIQVISAPDVSAGALMSKVDKVIMPIRALLYTGDCKTLAFGAIVAMAAKNYAKPVYGVAASYQWAPSIIGNENRVHDVLTLPPSKTGIPRIGHWFDLTEADEVSAIVTNAGMFAPSAAQLHMAELYTPRLEKDDLFDELIPAVNIDLNKK